jgi:hypothetical protein
LQALCPEIKDLTGQYLHLVASPEAFAESQKHVLEQLLTYGEPFKATSSSDAQAAISTVSRPPPCQEKATLGTYQAKAPHIGSLRNFQIFDSSAAPPMLRRTRLRTARERSGAPRSLRGADAPQQTTPQAFLSKAFQYWLRSVRLHFGQFRIFSNLRPPPQYWSKGDPI